MQNYKPYYLHSENKHQLRIIKNIPFSINKKIDNIFRVILYCSLDTLILMIQSPELIYIKTYIAKFVLFPTVFVGF